MERDAMIVAGFGFRKSADLSALRDALTLAQRDQPTVTALAAPHDKADQLAALAQALGLTLIPIDPLTLKSVLTITQSPVSLAARDTGSVAEAVALAAAGPGASLLTPRHISSDHMATCAIAQGAMS
jgi:cobalt-precorrin 5A hydrolase